jgi:hypothetical protein
LQANPEWHEATGLEDAFQEISDLFQKKSKVLENYNESQLEENFIRPVLRALGHFFGVQGKVLKKDRTPDYAFFPDQETKNEADTYLGVEDYYKKAVAVGDAKSWKVSLDKRRSGRGEFEMQNPSYQIDVYLRDTPPKWAVLTNGRLWRLYHESTSYKLDVFYEIDLPALLLARNLENFKYFYLFFRREAFPQVVDGDCFLDRVRNDSVAYAQEIGEDLKENVYKAMKILAEGFLAESSNCLDSSDEAIREVQDNALRLLYRLLFLFYAESRNLLDTNNKYYHELSLQKLKYEIAGRLDRGDPLLSVRYYYWEALNGLFSLINDGSESRGIGKDQFYIPAYNGGLFDPAKNRFLEEKKIGDSHLARALDLMARSQDRDKGFVDYSSLEIRHLGSIYEGLLEYRLKIADKEMVVVKEKGKEVLMATGEAGGRKILDTIPADGLYLVTDKGERKATGSYYTPDYIVKYIVKNTVEPIIKKKRQEWLGSNRPFAEYILSIKVLDPAMGSGHFLVEATDQLALWLVQAWATARPEEVESKDVAEQDIHWARREVVRNCIYGVDLNPMAVELAKLSLWLTTVASNKPLSFLDHHLRCGNSLIGAEMDKLVVLPNAKAEEQSPIWNFVLKQHIDALLQKYSLIASLPDDSLQMVKWKEERFREIQESELSRRLRELANIWLSTYFGSNVNDDDYYELQNHLSPEKFPDWRGINEKYWFRRAQELAAEKRFFHWEMEFPEAFNGGNRGFDVVIGNPPYVYGRDRSDSQSKLYFAESYPQSAYQVDLYQLFMEKAFMLLENHGLHGYIVPDSWTQSVYSQKLRKFILQNSILKSIVDLPSTVFPNVTVDTIIYIVENAHPVGHDSIEIVKFDNTITNPRCFIVRMIPQSDFLVSEKAQIRFSVSNDIKNIILKIESQSGLLGTILETVRGINAYDRARGQPEYIIKSRAYHSETRKDPTYVPLLMGEDLGRYVNRWNHDHWISYGEWLAAPRETRFFLSDKILVRKLLSSGRIVSYLDTEQFYTDQQLYIGLLRQSYNISIYFLCAILNSLIMSIYYVHSYRENGQLFPQLTVDAFNRLPICCISFTTPAPERSRLAQELPELYRSGKFDDILAHVEDCLPKDSQGNFIPEQEKSDVVHDLLAFLAEQMLEMNKQKQQEIKGFLSWLEGEVGAKTEDLSPKTKVQSYYDYDFNEFYTILKKNKKRLSINPSSREKSELLKDEFQKSVGKLDPLREKIELTDKFIDKVVYKLYGLTEEEIRIVEGSKSS